MTANRNGAAVGCDGCGVAVGVRVLCSVGLGRGVLVGDCAWKGVYEGVRLRVGDVGLSVFLIGSTAALHANIRREEIAKQYNHMTNRDSFVLIRFIPPL